MGKAGPGLVVLARAHSRSGPGCPASGGWAIFSMGWRYDLPTYRARRSIARDSRQERRLTHFSITEQEDGHLGCIDRGVCHDHVGLTSWKRWLSIEVEWT